MSAELCFHCTNAATKLCDFHIGCVITGYCRNGSVRNNKWIAVTGLSAIENGKAFYTCDRPLCDECASFEGTIFACGKKGFTESIDRCKDHAKIDDVDAPLLLEDEAKHILHELHVRVTAPRGNPMLVKP